MKKLASAHSHFPLSSMGTKTLRLMLVREAVAHGLGIQVALVIRNGLKLLVFQKSNVVF